MLVKLLERMSCAMLSFCRKAATPPTKATYGLADRNFKNWRRAASGVSLVMAGSFLQVGFTDGQRRTGIAVQFHFRKMATP
jgi:hypothetical protein